MGSEIVGLLSGYRALGGCNNGCSSMKLLLRVLG